MRVRFHVPCITAIVLLFLSVGCSAQTSWDSRPGTIRNALTLQDGSHVVLDAEIVDKIRARQIPAYFTITECFDRTSRLVVLTQPSPDLRMGQTVDVEGSMATLDDGQRAVVDVTVYGYTDKDGNLLYHGPLIKGPWAPEPWEWKVDLTVSSSESGSSPSQQSEMLPPGEVSTDSSVEVVTCATIADVKAQSLGTVVVIRCHPVSSGGTGSFTLGEDGGTDTLAVNYTGTVAQTCRVCVLSGTVDTTDDVDRVLDVDSGPNYNVQESFQGDVLAAPQGSIAWVKSWADGHTFSSGDLTGKIITRSWTDYLYIEDDSRANGIRVEKTVTAT